MNLVQDWWVVIPLLGPPMVALVARDWTMLMVFSIAAFILAKFAGLMG